MITLTQYVGPHRDSPDWTPAREQAATKLLAACSALEVEMARGGVSFPDNPATHSGVSGQTFGGFRPQNCPQGAPNSSLRGSTLPTGAVHPCSASAADSQARRASPPPK